MRDTAYLIFDARGIVRLVKGGAKPFPRAERRSKRPALERGEYACKIAIDVPDKFFAERPLPVATLVIPEAMIIEPRFNVTVTEPDAALESDSHITPDTEGAQS